ncbi:DUF1016 N-terminal domain-containing protein [Parapedobacter sp.]
MRTARTQIAKQVNSTTNSVYWNLGKLLSERQLAEGYGSGVVKQLLSAPTYYFLFYYRTNHHRFRHQKESPETGRIGAFKTNQL